MNLLPKYLEIARKYAVSHEYEKEIGFRHAAIVVSGGRILSVGYNGLHSDIRFNPKLAWEARRLQKRESC